MKRLCFFLSLILLLFLTACQVNNKERTNDRSLENTPKKRVHIAMLLPGKIDDEGFMEAGYDGLKKIEAELHADISLEANVRPEKEAMTAALETLAVEKPDMIIAHGSQTAEVTEQFAKQHPAIQFVVTQGHVKGANLSSYEVLQEESAYLAGAAAGLLTKSGTVGYISGIRIVSGLKARAAFADGLMKTNPHAKFLTSFTGNQDDASLARTYSAAQADAGGDIIFTMLNAGRQGVTDVLAKRGLKEIGNVRDYVAIEPDIFIGSAVADSGMAVYLAAERYIHNEYETNTIQKIGLENEAAVRLSLSNQVPDDVNQKIKQLSEQIKEGSIQIKTTYEGPEFEL